MNKLLLSADWAESTFLDRAFDTYLFTFDAQGFFEVEAFYRHPASRETTLIGFVLNQTTKPQLFFIEIWNEAGFEHPVMRFFSLTHEVQFPKEQLPLGGYTGTVSVLNYGNKSGVALARELIKSLSRGQTLVSAHEKTFNLMARVRQSQ